MLFTHVHSVYMLCVAYDMVFFKILNSLMYNVWYMYNGICDGAVDSVKGARGKFGMLF